MQLEPNKEAIVYVYNGVPTDTVKKPYYSTNASGGLQDSSVEKAKNLALGGREFNRIYSSPVQNTLESLILALGGSEESLKEYVEAGESLNGKKEITIETKSGKRTIVATNDLVNVRMGSLDGKTAKEIQKMWEEANPEAKWVPEANTCMDHPIGNADFEPYQHGFDERIKRVFKEISDSCQNDKETVLVFTHKEVLRHLLLLSQPAAELKETTLFKQMQAHEEPLERYHFDTQGGSWLKIRLKANQIFLCEASDGVIFRKEAPERSRGYKKDL